MEQRFTVTKIQKILVDMEESSSQGGSGLTPKGSEDLQGLQFSGHRVWRSREGSLEDLRASEGLGVIEGSQHVPEALGVSGLWVRRC